MPRNMSKFTFIHAFRHHTIVTILRNLRQTVFDLARTQSIGTMTRFAGVITAVTLYANVHPFELNAP